MIRKLSCMLLILALCAAISAGALAQTDAPRLLSGGYNTTRLAAVNMFNQTPRLTFGNSYYKKYDDNKIGFSVKIRNDYNKSIKAIELYMYATDVWGERLYGETTYYYKTTKKTVKSGSWMSSDYMVMPKRSKIDRIYVAVHRIAFADGTSKTFYSPSYDTYYQF